jgi:flagellar biosynthesis protein FlhG
VSNNTSIKQLSNKTFSTKTNVPRVVAITSGKGGVGKTHTALNVSIALQNLGYKSLLVDADFSLANVNVMLGVSTQGDLEDVFLGCCPLESIILTGPSGLSFIPASSGAEAMTALTASKRVYLKNEIERVGSSYDYIIFDTQAGIGDDTLYFCAASCETIVVVTTDPTSLTDAYALIKLLSTKYGERHISIIVNNIGGIGISREHQAEEIYMRLADSVRRFLGVSVNYLGYIPSDPLAAECIQTQKPLLNRYPGTYCSKQIVKITRCIIQQTLHLKIKGGVQFFFEEQVNQI